SRAVRTEHELNVILVDEALDELGAARGCGLVVVVLDDELIGLVADLDAAHLVDARNGEIVAVLRVLAVGRILAGERDRRAEDDGRRRSGLRGCVGKRESGTRGGNDSRRGECRELLAACLHGKLPRDCRSNLELRSWFE